MPRVQRQYDPQREVEGLSRIADTFVTPYRDVSAGQDLISIGQSLVRSSDSLSPYAQRFAEEATLRSLGADIRRDLGIQAEAETVDSAVEVEGEVQKRTGLSFGFTSTSERLRRQVKAESLGGTPYMQALSAVFEGDGILNSPDVTDQQIMESVVKAKRQLIEANGLDDLQLVAFDRASREFTQREIQKAYRRRAALREADFQQSAYQAIGDAADWAKANMTELSELSDDEVASRVKQLIEDKTKRYGLTNQDINKATLDVLYDRRVDALKAGREDESDFYADIIFNMKAGTGLLSRTEDGARAQQRYEEQESRIRSRLRVEQQEQERLDRRASEDALDALFEKLGADPLNREKLLQESLKDPTISKGMNSRDIAVYVNSLGANMDVVSKERVASLTADYYDALEEGRTEDAKAYLKTLRESDPKTYLEAKAAMKRLEEYTSSGVYQEAEYKDKWQGTKAHALQVSSKLAGGDPLSGLSNKIVKQQLFTESQRVYDSAVREGFTDALKDIPSGRFDDVPVETRREIYKRASERASDWIDSNVNDYITELNTVDDVETVAAAGDQAKAMALKGNLTVPPVVREVDPKTPIRLESNDVFLDNPKEILSERLQAIKEDRKALWDSLDEQTQWNIQKHFNASGLESSLLFLNPDSWMDKRQKGQFDRYVKLYDEEKYVNLLSSYGARGIVDGLIKGSASQKQHLAGQLNALGIPIGSDSNGNAIRTFKKSPKDLTLTLVRKFPLEFLPEKIPSPETLDGILETYESYQAGKIDEIGKWPEYVELLGLDPKDSGDRALAVDIYKTALRSLGRANGDIQATNNQSSNRRGRRSR